MMSFLKYLMLTLVMMFSSQSAWASIAGSGTGGVLNKITIYGHTGQDPVYRSHGGNGGDRLPINLEPGVPSLPKFDSRWIIVDETLGGIDWTIVYDNPSTITTIDVNPSTWGPVHSNQIVDRRSSLLDGGNVPAPPVLFLLLSGFVHCSRRKP